MRGHTKLTLLIFTVLVLIVTAMAALRGQDHSGRPRTEEQKTKEYLDKFPIVDYESSEPTDVDEREKRRTKNKTYNNRHGEKPKLSEIGIGALHIDWEFALDSALPAAQSSAVIVGEVIGAKAYLSEDKTNVYSEYTVKVEEIFKDDGREPITVGNSVITERVGGRARFPSGRIASLYISGQGAPQVGRRYLLFLGYNKAEANHRSLTSLSDMVRHILTGYELSEGKVFPLDHAGGKNFQDYQGKDEAAFLSEIRRSISSSL